MKLKIDSKLVVKQISLITKLINEATIIATKDEFRIVEMDPANVSLTIFKLHNSAFAQYELAEGKDEERLGVNLNNLKTCLKRAKPDDILTLELKDNQLLLDIGEKRHYKLPTLELEDKEQKIPELKFKAKIVMPIEELITSVEDAGIVAESFAITVTKDGKATIKAEGDISQVNIDLDNDEKITAKAEEDSTSKYSIEYISKMLSKSLGATEVTIHFANDYPMKLVYTSELFSLSFVTAPRVENS